MAVRDIYDVVDDDDVVDDVDDDEFEDWGDSEAEKVGIDRDYYIYGGT